MAQASLDPLIAAQVAALREFRDIDISVEDIRQGSELAEYADRFTLVIPCCLERLRWHVLYNAQHPLLAPDVIFPEDDATDFQPLAAIWKANPEVPGGTPARAAWGILRDWNIRDPHRLLHLILELRTLYMQHQRQLVENVSDARVRFEIGTITELEGVEMCLVGNAQKGQEVQIAIPLAGVDLSPIAALAARGGPPRDGASPMRLSLQVRFPLVKDGQRAAPPQLKLLSPTAVLEALSLADTKLPGWTESTCLMEYVPVLQSQLQAQVEEACAALNFRKRFLAALPAVFGRPLEVDTLYFRRATFFVTCGTSSLLVHFSLSVKFPWQQPSLVLQSIIHFDMQGRPIASQPYTDYPWSPRWELPEMAQRICRFIVSESTNFKHACSDMQQRR